MNQTTPPTNPYQINQPQPNPQIDQPKQHTQEETTTMENAEQQQTTTKTKPTKLKPPPDLKKTMKTTPKSRKQTNKSKQQHPTNIKSINLFFEQYRNFELLFFYNFKYLQIVNHYKAIILVYYFDKF